eukprot:10570341-Ditylum_brightwellii.AAC.1
MEPELSPVHPVVTQLPFSKDSTPGIKLSEIYFRWDCRALYCGGPQSCVIFVLLAKQNHHCHPIHFLPKAISTLHVIVFPMNNQVIRETCHLTLS